MACFATTVAGAASSGITARAWWIFVPESYPRLASLPSRLPRVSFRTGKSMKFALTVASSAREGEFARRGRPSLALVSRSLHLCFSEICVQNLGRPAAAALHEFVSSAVLGYLAGYTRGQLALQLAYGEDEEFKLSTEGYRLTASEEHYRSQWLDTIYSTLQILKVADNEASRSPPVAVDQHLRSIIHRTIEGQASDSELSHLRFDRGLATRGASGGAISEKSVVAPQWIPVTQLILLTLKVTKETLDQPT